MRTTAARFATIAALSAFALAGCGASSEEPSAEPTINVDQSDGGEAQGEAPEPSNAAEEEAWPEVEGDPSAAPMDDGSDGEEWEYDPAMLTPGSYITVGSIGELISVQLDPEAPADLEEYREATQGEPVNYITVSIDNTYGTDFADVSDVSIVDASGNTFEYSAAFLTIEEWGPVTEDYETYYMPDGTEIPYDEANEMENRGSDLYNEYLDTGALPAAKDTQVLIGTDPVPDDIAYIEAVSAMESLPLTLVE